MRILVTGGAGFIGSYLCRYLHDDGHHIICMDNLCTSNGDNIQCLTDSNWFQFIDHDISERLPFVKADYILHFASPASPADYLNMPIETLRVGSAGTYNILELARKQKIPILIASTSEVYGDPQKHPQSEDYWGHVNPIGPRGVYDEAKRFQEAMAMAYHRVHGLDVRIVRIFNTYGPHMRVDDGRAIPNFINQMLLGKPITVHNDGKQTRSFCYITDTVNGIIKYMQKSIPFVGPINIGNPAEYRIMDLIDQLGLLLDVEHIDLVYHDIIDDPMQRQPDIRLAKKVLDWEPKVDLIDGLQSTCEYFKDKLYDNTKETTRSK